ncbi:hypothetical protein [Herbaspirillum sp. RV1423]|uniref:hypothetical protein n=1 Tax=Herbaspirillum sp. RV1423 TaxID=1443993 RepID=UPI0004B5B5C2|nr:hypothetical protein [Herbaspirillum sp. RV1423]
MVASASASSLAGESSDTSATSAESRNAAKKAIADMKGVDAAQTEVDNIGIFAKMLKKAEDGAQAAL